MQFSGNGAVGRNYSPAAYEQKDVKTPPPANAQSRAVTTEGKRTETAVRQAEAKPNVTRTLQTDSAEPPKVTTKKAEAPPSAPQEPPKQAKLRETAVTLPPTETVKAREAPPAKDKEITQQMAVAAYREAAATNDTKKMQELSEFIPPVPITEIKPPSAPPGYLPSLESLFTVKEAEKPTERSAKIEAPPVTEAQKEKDSEPIMAERKPSADRMQESQANADKAALAVKAYTQTQGGSPPGAPSKPSYQEAAITF